MTAAGRPALNLLLALIGLLAAALLAHSSARHGGSLICQTLIGTAAYIATTALAGRPLGIHPADAVAGSITTLAAAVAGALGLTGLLLTTTARHLAARTTADAGSPSPFTKTT